MEGLRAVKPNRSFWTLWVVFGTLIGAFNTFTTLVSDYIVPYGYTESVAGNLGVAALVPGIIVAVIVGRVLDRTKTHRKAIKVLPWLSVVGMILFIVATMAPGREIMLYLASAFIGVGGFPSIPIALELGVECTFPIAAGTTSGLLWIGGQIMGLPLLLISDALRDPQGGLRNAMYLMLFAFLAAAVCAQFYKAGNRRVLLEAEGGDARAGEAAAAIEPKAKETSKETA
ncbi:hypothetical protein HK101_002361 [Irineochytrium annulatum]|nr:hypothetical protein HK101_002361 [Irineochytrium annulatum]